MKEVVCAYLTEKHIPYELTEHEAVYTMEDMRTIGLDKQGILCKNLFVRDGKGKQHFLIVARDELAVNLKALGEQLGASKLGFASKERLEKYLGLSQGSVSPFGILNDTAHAVTVVLDQGLEGTEKLGLHPNDNTATLWIGYQELRAFIDAQGNPTIMI